MQRVTVARKLTVTEYLFCGFLCFGSRTLSRKRSLRIYVVWTSWNSFDLTLSHHTIILCYSTAAGARPITSLEQTALTTVRVTWSPIPELPVSYRVHYLLAGGTGGKGTKTVAADTTSTEITGLTNRETYIISVEVVSSLPNVIPAVAEEIITLGMHFLLPHSHNTTESLMPHVKIIATLPHIKTHTHTHLPFLTHYLTPPLHFTHSSRCS